MTAVPVTPSGAGTRGNSLGVTVEHSGADSAAATGSTTYPGDSNANGGLKPVGAAATTPLPPVEKPADAPETINDVKPGSQPAVPQTATDSKKNPKAPYDGSSESSSKHKKKKGIDKLNPF
jgi:outer membrane protein assembly factor BamD